jgi:hypothetical protein
MGKIFGRESKELTDPLFWLTQNIHNIIQDRQINNVIKGEK